MSQKAGDGDAVVDLEAIDALADRLERELQGGRFVPLEELVAGVPPRLRDQALEVLAALDMDYRHRAGQTIDPDDYVRRFPALGQAGTGDGRSPMQEIIRALCKQYPDLKPILDPATRALDAHGPAVPHAPQIAGYRITGHLGEGSMGVVWSAVQLGTSRPVALKVINASGLGSARARTRFVREVELAASLQHPSIARVYDSGVHAGVYYYTMELVEGTPLDQHVSSAQLARRQVLELMQRVCRGVQYAHQRGIIHRDLKPGNILVSADGQPHILDFGVAKALLDDSHHSISLEGSVAGTPAYMSPEQAEGDGEQVDTRSDVYALGVILYRLLTNKHPHELSGSHLDVMRRIAEREIIPPRTADPTLDGELDSLLRKALAKEPDERYSTAGELASEIGRYLDGEPLSSHHASLAYVLKKRLKKHRVPLALGTAVLLLLAGMGVWSYVNVSAERSQAVASAARENTAANKARQAEAAAKDREQQIGSMLADHLVTSGWTEYERGEGTLALLHFAQALRIKPDPQHRWRVKFMMGQLPRLCVLSAALPMTRPNYRQPHSYSNDGQKRYEWLKEHDGRYSYDESVQVVRVSDDKPLTPPLPCKMFSLPVFSPDSTKIATNVDKENVRIWDANTGKPATPTLPCTGTVSFSSDSTHILTIDDKLVRVWNVGTQTPTMKVLPHTRPVKRAQFSQDTKQIVTLSGDGTAQVWALPGGTPTCSPLEHLHEIREALFSPDGTKVLTLGHKPESAQLWDALTGRQLTGPLPHIGDSPPVFSPDGARLVTLCERNAAQIWDAESGRPVTPPLRHARELLHVFFSPKGGQLVTASWDAVRVWDATSGEPVTPFLHRTDGGGLPGISQDAMLVAGGDRSRPVWNIGVSTSEVLLPGHELAVFSAMFSEDCKRVATASKDRTARVCDVATGLPLTPALRHAEEVWRIAFSPDGAKIVTSGDGKTARVWSIDTGTPLTTPLEHQLSILSAAFNLDGTRIVTASADQTARVWDASRGTPITPPLKHNSVVYEASFSPDGTRVVTASWDKTARVWDASNGKPVTPRLLHARGLNGASFSPNGEQVICASSDANGNVCIWNVATASVSKRLPHPGEIYCATFNRNGTQALTTSSDRTVKLWDVASGRLLLTVRHDDEAAFGAFSADGLRMITVSRDEAARVWDTTTGRPLTPPLRHSSGADVHLSPMSNDGSMLATASEDGTARLWRLAPITLSDSDLLDYAEVLSAHRFDESGALVEMKQDEWDERFTRIAKRLPELFFEPPSERIFNEEMSRLPADPNRLLMFGRWFHQRSAHRWAAQLLEKARSAGAAPDPLLLARCNWLAGNYDRAIAAFEQVIATNKDPRQDAYLKQCLNAVRHEATEKKSP